MNCTFLKTDITFRRGMPESDINKPECVYISITVTPGIGALSLISTVDSSQSLELSIRFFKS